jgi:hypothetical protein
MSGDISMTDGPFIFGIEPPEGMREELQRQVDKQIMTEQAFYHDVGRLWLELKPDQLVTIKTLLVRLGRLDDPTPALAYYGGVIATTLQLKHNVCESCGVDHDAALMQEPTPTPADPRTESPVDKLIRTHGEPFEPVNQAEFDAKHAEYNVRLYTQDDLDNGLVVGPNEQPVICIGCSLLYQSLEDRMLRPPDGCQGCHLKSAHG